MLTISAHNRYIRFFLWAWQAEIRDLNLCTLFWGTLFLPIALVTWWPISQRFRVPRALVPLGLLAWRLSTWPYMEFKLLAMTVGLVGFLFLLPTIVLRSYGNDWGREVMWKVDTGMEYVANRRWLWIPLAVMFFPVTILVLIVTGAFWLLEKLDQAIPAKGPRSSSNAGVGAILRNGYRSVKSRTCEIVNIIE